ncbi:MAG: beta-carotene 15,15'-monooxygenase [Bacteroidetes bacterium]|nr:beta-carotene 15,15'-monooxygenase [Bacteroidota bacterium]
MDKNLPIFRKWVPEWLIKIILFSTLLPSVVLFFLPLSNINAAAGYYGSEPADIQFSVALFYAGYVGFYSLERRFFAYLAAKEYFIAFTFLNIAATLLCYYTHEIYIFFPVRFIQGMMFSSTVNLSLSLIFARLHSERAREIGFSVFFGMLISALPLNNLITADVIDAYNFNVVYKAAIFSYIPGLLMLIISMNQIRLNVRFPLYSLDWQSFVCYSLILTLIGYIMVYGQEYYWLEDARILYSVMAILFFSVLYFFRQRSMKRPYIHLEVLKHRNFNVGILLLFIMYLCRFPIGITNNYFANVLKFDPLHVSYINAFNLVGLVVGVIISAAMLLQRKPIRYMWIPGFVLLLVFYTSMFYLFDVYADEFNYFIPLFIQGMGVGMIMVPSIVYAISSVRISLGPSAAALCLAVRYLGFCVSIALMNYFELYEKSRHYNAFQDKITLVDPVVKHTLSTHFNQLITKGFVSLKPTKASGKMLVNSVNMQNHLRYAMDYYELISWVLVGTIILIMAVPYLNKTVVYLKSRVLSPA